MWYPQLCPLGRNPCLKSFRPTLKRFLGRIFLEEDAGGPAACFSVVPVRGLGVARRVRHHTSQFPDFRVSWSFNPHKTQVGCLSILFWVMSFTNNQFHEILSSSIFSLTLGRGPGLGISSFSLRVRRRNHHLTWVEGRLFLQFLLECYPHLTSCHSIGSFRKIRGSGFAPLCLVPDIPFQLRSSQTFLCSVPTLVLQTGESENVPAAV